MNIGILAAGAGGMYCGSCMRDTALATALRRQGHAVTLIPLYSPVRSEQEIGGETSEVYFGGINVFLQHASRLFRHTPRALDWVFDRPWLLNAATRMGAQTAPEKLADLTLSVLEGEDGSANKELDRLVHFLRDSVKPDVVCLPNAMFVGMAKTFRRELKVPVICELTGEDIFLDAMKEEDRREIRRVICERAADVSLFVATSEYYAAHMAEYLDVPQEQIDVVYTGISEDYLTPIARPAGSDRPLSIGYLARICPEKGLDRLIDAFQILVKMPDLRETRLVAAGYLGSRDKKWFDALRARINDAGLGPAFTYLGEVNLTAKLAMLDSIDVFSVPTAYPEAKGIYVLEAMARGVPVVQPAHGSFPELLTQTQGGRLTPPGDPHALADALADLLRNPSRRQELGHHGRAAVASSFTETQMAAQMVAVFQAALSEPAADPARGP